MSVSYFCQGFSCCPYYQGVSKARVDCIHLDVLQVVFSNCLKGEERVHIEENVQEFYQ